MILMPVVVVFFQSRGLTVGDIFLLRSVNAVGIILMEIPTGYLADVLGRKRTLLIGTVLGFAGFSLYNFAHGIELFAVAELCIGMGASFLSGADSAMLFDTLESANKTQEYTKYEGRILSLGNFAEALGGIVGGFLATLSINYPSIAQACIAAIGIPSALLLWEPTPKGVRKHLSVRHIVRIIHNALFVNRRLAWNIVFSSVIGCATLTTAWFVQPYFGEIGLPLAWYGIVWTGLNLLVGLISLQTYRIEIVVGTKPLVWIVAVGIGLSLTLTGILPGYWGLATLTLFYAVRGVATPLLKDLINRETDSDVRATVLSLRSLIIRSIFAILGPLYGWANDQYSLTVALVFSGLLFLFFSLTSLFFYFRFAARMD
ncbi:MAG: hypothetical protein RIS47_294 [Bacteroidota bacterium]